MAEASKIDKENMISVLDNFWKQCDDASRLGKNIVVGLPVNGIVICGMGGSAIPGDIIQSYIDVSYPIIVNRGYDIPRWVDKKTLVFVISYSGNTEESLSCFRQAKLKEAKIVGISSGGKLEKFCFQGSVPFIKVPSGIQPRDASGYLTLPLLNVLNSSRIINMPSDEYEGLMKSLAKDYHDKAEELAKKLVNKIPIIYASGRMACVARAWKTKINENAKVQAFWNEFPELNHNEMVGFTDLKGDFFVIMIEDEKDHPRVAKRMKITAGLLKSKGCHVLTMKVSGKNRLSNIFSTILMGSYVGYYLALEYGTDPSPVVLVENLKKDLGEYIK